MEQREKIARIVQAIQSKKGFDVVTIDVSERASVCDAFVVGSANNANQTAAIADKIVEDLEKAGEPPVRVEGGRGAKWIALDFSSVIVHVFEKETREDYRFEDLWNDGTNLERILS